MLCFKQKSRIKCIKTQTLNTLISCQTCHSRKVTGLYLPHNPVVLVSIVMSMLSMNSLLCGVNVSVKPCCSDPSWCRTEPICFTVIRPVLKGTAVSVPSTNTCSTENMFNLLTVHFIHAYTYNHKKKLRNHFKNYFQFF